MAPVLTAEITRRDLEDLPTQPSYVASITDVRHLSSYNWIEAPTPTIAVPGSPALWSAPGGPRQLKKDSGLIYIAQNAARHPDSPLEPLFRALHITNPSFDLRSIDVVTDRNNIRKLLSFVNPGLSSNGLEPFTIGIEVIKNTAIFCREETKTHEFIGLHEFKGFGHEFEKAYTKSRVTGDTGHHRIIAYRFGDLNFIVRHETDGYVATTLQASSSKGPEYDGLSGMLASLSLSPNTGLSVATSAESKLRIRKEGEVVPLHSTLEVKTRVFHKRLEIRDVAPQLWVSQTPKLVRAYHRNGTFQEPEVEDVADAIRKWEQDNHGDLRKLAALINKILSVAKELGGSMVMRYDTMGDKLVVSKVAGKKMLPDDLYSKWDDASVETAVSRQPRIPETSLTKYRRYLESHQQLLSKSQTSTAESSKKRADVPFFDVITYSVEHGFRHFFRRMPCQLADYRVLCNSLNTLAVDVVKQQRLQDVVRELKTRDDDYDPLERRAIKGSKAGARNAAFTMLYLFLVDESLSPARDGTVAYNAVLYIVSHGRKFKYRTRKMVREAFEARFVVTHKQRMGLDKWPITSSQQDGGQDTEGTTEEEADDYLWDSDWS
ncbi:geranylgeranyl pyrophosphate synthetase [Microdochium trichocladiopsis]|uniref:Geranylgeranyl pyrophosphate synthetase n=1 Tax=Microdochium trichocladiopsis TaxID=1682393 RepID=A0A9P9BP68_9PEZI|nr:geranylgeranyl pyrophosphate synthetase [Microdochium trichocladiopsis]KAH7021583.1 geranylgeranyl pyrophosphate synthetase [Microdochium trichocladiopsis]